MNKSISLVIIALGLLLGACSQQKAGKSEITKKVQGKTYNGIIPCADCEGILYEVTFNKDHTYEASSVYIGESNRPFVDNGTWKVKKDTLLALQVDSTVDKTLAVEDSSLVMLDKNGKRVTGALADHYVLDQVDSLQQEKNNWAELREQGVDFRAGGNEPFWSLTIDFDNQMTINVMDGDSISASVPKMKQDTASAARVMQAETESRSVRVELHPTACMDSMSGEVSSHRVVVEYGDKTYRGCGNYLSEEYKLHDFWVLHSLEGNEISSQDSLRKKPALQFDLQNNKVAGNTSCNQLNGQLTVSEDSLSFSKVAMTKMACQKSIEPQFMKALQQVNRYEIRNEELLLLKDNDTLMVFRRAM